MAEDDTLKALHEAVSAGIEVADTSDDILTLAKAVRALDCPADLMDGIRLVIRGRIEEGNLRPPVLLALAEAWEIAKPKLVGFATF
jgi:hypothetical protein